MGMQCRAAKDHTMSAPPSPNACTGQPCGLLASNSLPWYWALALGAALAAPDAFAQAVAPGVRAQPCADRARPAPERTAARVVPALAGGPLVRAQELPVRQLRVCADPDNLPFSSRNEEGFENRIAALVARELNATVRYTWWAHRSGFLRNTLNAGLCDVVMGVPRGLDAVMVTRAYYRSSYAFVYQSGRYSGLRSLDDPRLHELRIGLTRFESDDANTPPAHALARRKLIGNVVGYPVAEDHATLAPAVRIVEAVAAGEADVALVWGPVAGYFAARQRVPLAVVPVSPAFDPPGLPMQFDIAVGVRPGDTSLRDEIDEVLERRRDEIHKILRGYGVPLVPEAVLGV